MRSFTPNLLHRSGHAHPDWPARCQRLHLGTKLRVSDWAWPASWPLSWCQQAGLVPACQPSTACLQRMHATCHPHLHLLRCHAECHPRALLQPWVLCRCHWLACRLLPSLGRGCEPAGQQHGQMGGGQWSPRQGSWLEGRAHLLEVQGRKNGACRNANRLHAPPTGCTECHGMQLVQKRTH